MLRWFVMFMSALFLVGCPGVDDDDAGDDDTADDDAGDDDTGDDDTGDDDTGDDDTGDDDTGDDDTGDDDTAAVDCDNLPAGPLAYTTLSGLYASEDFCFDDAGHLISHDVNALFRQTYPPVTATPFAVTAGGPGGPASMRMLSTGDLVYANVDTSTLYRVAPDGDTTVIYGALGYATGIEIHSSGKVFQADLNGIMRIDPYSKTMDLLIGPGVLNFPNGMTFSADYSTLFFGTSDGIYSVPVDAAGTPTADPAPWAASPDGGELLGMGVDVCDNVYALHQGRRLLRYSPGGGDPEILIEASPEAWMTNLQWGSGVGGWSSTAIYITDRNFQNPTYFEIEVGAPSKPY